MNESPQPRRVAVIGAGPAGLTAAYQLARQGVLVDVYEASDSVGGLSKTIDLWNQKVDIGPHRFFSSDSRVNRFWLDIVGKDYRMVNRLTRIYYKRKFFYYPLKPFDALRKLGIFTAAQCLLSYFAGKISPSGDESTFEGWISRRFGKKLYRIFFKTYTEKLWGIPCTELDADFAAQRIKKLSLWEALKNALIGGKGNKHKTLVDQFAYPTGGTGMVYTRMAEYLTQNGHQVLLKTPVDAVLKDGDKATGLRLKNGTEIRYDEIISTMPLSLMVRSLPDVPKDIHDKAGSLSFRNTLIVYLHVNNSNLFGDNWLYVHAADLQMGRITNFRNWVPEITQGQNASILALEYWCYDNDTLWNCPEQDLIELGKQEIIKTGLVNAGDILDGMVYRIPRCYPVYSKGYKENLKPVEQYLSSISNLHVIGRYGAFKYNNQDHSILMGLLAAENIVKGTHHDLWEINTDYEEYQEKSVITETGLVVE
ncbi:MAG: FAD-dependent oxidoreductase [Bacteroidetes bacterium]|nr:FAD-dependent oxidoreductase [Bacteroidota bacterium]